MKTSNFQLHTPQLSTSDSPLVSIITVVYNGKKHIEQTIQSVLSQTYTNIEYIIIDGASTDGTLAIIQKYKSSISQIVSEKDTGIYNAMNKGLALAKGEIIAILNADDYYYPETIELVVNQFNQSKAEIVYGSIVKLKEINNQEYFKEVQPNLDLIEETMPIFHPATFIKKQVYDQVGKFNEKYRVSADYDLIYKIYRAGFTFELLDKPLAIFRLGGVTSANCTSYKEGYLILKSYDSPYTDRMKKLITKCKLKRSIQKISILFIQILGLKKWNEKRLVKKWS